LALPAVASAELGFYGWGLRLGLGDDPDQVIVGIHQDLGEFAPRVGFQPSFEAGFGDDHTVLAIALPVHYRFKVKSAVKPYAGGGAQLAWIDRDHPRGKDDSEFDIAPFITGGVAWPAFKSSDLFLELSIGGGEAHSAKVFLGWMIRRR
jgi:hypothetical protein